LLLYYLVYALGYIRARAKPNEAKKGFVVTSATRRVIRPPSRGLFKLGTKNAYVVMFAWR
jgi:hypothetical protein